MSDFSVLQSKITAFKAIVEQGTITPSSLGTILDGLYSFLQSPDKVAAIDTAIQTAKDLKNAIGAAKGIAPLDALKKIPPAYIPFGETEGSAYPGEKGYNLNYSLNQLTHDFDDFQSSRGKANGLAPLDEDGIIPARFIPGAMDDVKEFDGIVTNVAVSQITISGSVKVMFNTTTGSFIAMHMNGASAEYVNNWEGADNYGAFSEDGRIPADDKIYVDRSTNKTYRWSGTRLVVIGTDLALGHTAGTAYPGNEGNQLRTDFDMLRNEVSKKNLESMRAVDANSWLDEDAPFLSLSDVLTRLSDDVNSNFSYDMLLYAMIEDDSKEGWSWKLYKLNKNVYSEPDDWDFADPANWSQLGEENTHKVFDDQWLAAVGAHGTIDRTHYDEPDASGNRRHTPYYLNTLWLTYEEAVKVMEAKPPRTPDLTRFLMNDAGVRTNLPLKNMPDGGGGANSAHVTVSMAFNAPDLEVVNTGGSGARFRFKGYGEFINAFNGAKLHTIIGNIDFFNSGVYPSGSDHNHIMFGPALRNVQIINLDKNLKLSSPVISLESLQYMIQHSNAPAKGVTLTLHPDVYAKITDTANTDWHALLDLAAQKNINIATTA